METRGRELKLWSFKQAHLFVNNKLAVIGTMNYTSHQCKQFYFKIGRIFTVTTQLKEKKMEGNFLFVN